MKHLKITSVLLSISMCASMVMTPVSVIADDSAAPEETQTAEVTEQEETKKETEKPAPKETEKKETEATEKTESAETEKQEPEETVKETETQATTETEAPETDKPEETEEQKPAETEKQEPSATEQTEPETAEPQESTQTEKSESEETVPEVKPEKGSVTTARRKASNEAAFTKNQGNTCLGTSKIAKPATPDDSKAWTGSYVYFGTYDGKPIRFRVLAPSTTAYGGTTMFLDSDKSLFYKKFDDDSNDWANREIKSYLNGDFLNGFKLSEINTIAQSKRSAHALEEGTTAGKVTSWTKAFFLKYVALNGERVFLLDAEEATNVDYGYSLTNTNAVNRKKTGVSDWLLRSASTVGSDYAGNVSLNGFLGVGIVNGYGGVAPALNINLSSVIFSSKISGDFGKTGAEYKLTVKDPNLTIAVPAGQQAEISGTTVTIPYKIGGKNAGTANRISYLITNKGGTEIKYYNALSGGTSGTGTFTLPSDLFMDSWGKEYEVYILAEQVNGSQTTDYASAPVKVASPFENTLTVSPKTAKVKYKKLRKKKQTVARAKVMNVSSAKGNVTYKLTGVKRGKSKKYKKYFKINATTGNVTIKKKLKKGTYKVTCVVKAAGDSNYKAGTKTVTFTIKVK